MKRLSQSALAGLPADVTRPRYNRAAVTPGIVHLGVGAFHRGHQAVFVDDCLGRGETGWGIVAASLRSPATRDALAPQDNLYTYCERNGETETLRVIGSIIECLVAPEDPARLIERLADPRVRVVTLTVTEKGYLADLSRGRLLADHPDILHDLENPDVPRTIHGYLFAASQRRREEGSVPLTLVSCDNLPSNGRLLQALFGEFARLADPQHGAAIAGALSCPCVMVDRIVPATTETDRQGIAARLGVEDAWPVVAEPYFRWVIEDRFPHGRPGLEKSGAEFVADVEPFEHMKLRMLNGAHTAIAAIGQVAGFDTVADTYGRDEVRRFIDAYWGEVAPTLAPEVDGESYVAGLRGRFANPALRHRAAQIATDASQKVPQRILAPLGELLDQGRACDAVTTALALWIRSYAALNERGQSIAMNDPAFDGWAAPDQAKDDAETVVDGFLGFARVFGPDWRRRGDFVAALTRRYDTIRTLGVFGALGQF
jgi:fructuronate reductase